MVEFTNSESRDSKGAPKTRLASMDAAEEKRAAPEGDAMEICGVVTGERERAPAEEVMELDISDRTQEEWCREGDSHASCAAA